MFLPNSISFPWKPEQVSIQGKNGYVINPKQVEYIKDLIKALGMMYSDISNVVNKNASIGPPLVLDGTLGLVLRCSRVAIDDGTNPNTISCRLYNVWNGDENGVNVDNIAKDNNYYGGFSLNVPGEVLTISPTILSGNPVFALGWIIMNDTGDVGLSCDMGISTGGGGETYIGIEIPTFTGGLSWYDIAALVDVGTFQVKILYLTDA